MIAIIDYGMGNLRSVQKALEVSGAQACITQSPLEIKNASKVVLPGVGAMAPAMQKLQELGLVGVIKEAIHQGKPFLGICLGMQLLFESSTEGGFVHGLGVLKGTVERFSQLKVPHMGWNQLQITAQGKGLYGGVSDLSNVYFCHSYYVKPMDQNIIASTTKYGIDFASSVVSSNVWAVQFHPEKSQTVGLTILKNFIKI